jgi:hypothetical protein
LPISGQVNFDGYRVKIRVGNLRAHECCVPSCFAIPRIRAEGLGVMRGPSYVAGARSVSYSVY